MLILLYILRPISSPNRGLWLFACFHSSIRSKCTIQKCMHSIHRGMRRTVLWPITSTTGQLSWELKAAETARETAYFRALFSIGCFEGFYSIVMFLIKSRNIATYYKCLRSCDVEATWSKRQVRGRGTSRSKVARCLTCILKVKIPWPLLLL